VNEQIERQLEAELHSDSRGYIVDRPMRQLVTATVLDGGSGSGMDPARWSTPEAVAVGPRAGVTELLKLARSRER
jgi:hypothetical protein